MRAAPARADEDGFRFLATASSARLRRSLMPARRRLLHARIPSTSPSAVPADKRSRTSIRILHERQSCDLHVRMPWN